MSDLKSQTISPTTPSQLPILTGPATAAIFLKKAREILRSQFGEVGQNILNSTKTTLDHPGPCPHYSDPRLHPITSAPIPNTRKYARITKTPDQTADSTFDDNTLPLTDAGEAKFNQDLKTWHTNNDRYHRLLDKHRDNDDGLLTLLHNNISLDALEVIRSNPLYPAYLALPGTCITRSDSFIKIIDSQFSHGNSTVSVNELTKYLMLTQGSPSSDPAAAFFNRLSEHYDRVIPLLDHAKTLAQLKAMLNCMVAIKGLNKSHPPTLRALEIHVQNFPGNTALDHFDELRTAVLAAQDSDLANLNTDPPSEQSSAFKASVVVAPPTTPQGPPPKPGKGQQIPGRTDHCTYCLRNFKKYWYHLDRNCNFKKNGITKLDGTKPPTRPTLTAKLAELDAKIAAIPTSPPEPQLTQEQVIAFLATQGFHAQFDQQP
jgi:hypothetical protein